MDPKAIAYSQYLNELEDVERRRKTSTRIAMATLVVALVLLWAPFSRDVAAIQVFAIVLLVVGFFMVIQASESRGRLASMHKWDPRIDYQKTLTIKTQNGDLN